MTTRTLNISLPEELIKRADRQAKRQQSNRSELMREALRDYLNRREKWEAVLAIGKEYGRKSGIKEEDVVAVVRAYRKSKHA